MRESLKTQFRGFERMVSRDNVALASATAFPDQTFADRLRSVSWDFAGKRTSNPLDKLHPYPAKFIPELPGALLDSLPLAKGALILDPFCGSGTALTEAQRRGFDAIGVDLNPIACLISRVRTAPLPKDALEEMCKVVDRAKKLPHARIPTIPNLSHWFEQSARVAIARLVEAIGMANASTHDFLKLALSSVLVRVSNQESDTRYAAIRKNISEALVYSSFESAAKRIAGSLSGRLGNGTVQVVEHDTLDLPASRFERKVDAIITSPPYPNAYEYWLYHKYRMWWLGYDPIAIKEREIGARAHFFGSKRHDETSFVFQMKQLFNLIDKVLSANGFACFIVGRSKIHGKIVDNANIIRAAGKAIGMRDAFCVEREISPNRKSFNLSHANIKTETVLVLSR